MKKTNKRISLGFLFGVVGFLLGALFYLQPKRIDPAQFHGTYLEKPRPVNPFSLSGIDEKIFDNSSLEGKWTLVFFGFTNCAYMCPTTMAELGKMYSLLVAKKAKNLPKIVMITVDPARDDLTKLGNFVKAFNPNFYGARGEDVAVTSLAREMGIAFAKIQPKNSPNSQEYDIEHSGAVMLFNPKGELNAFFTTPHHAELLVKDYLLLTS
jgi:protein SCO1/2